MYKNKKVAVACLALVLVVLVSVVFQALPPPNTQSGRVFRYEAFIRTYKEPEDDPWDSDATLILASTGLFLHTTISVESGSSRSLSMFARIHPTQDFFTEVSITATFTFASTTTVTQRIRTEAGRNILYIPSRTYQPGVQYRWRITIPSYQSSDLIITAFPLIRSPTSLIYELRASAECGYWSGGQLVFSTSDLSVGTAKGRLNQTHIYIIYSINFGSTWIGRQVSSCTIFTTDGINDINSYLQSTGQRTITSGRLYLVIVSNLNVVVEQGDRVEVLAYYITTPNL
ncbi:MAG: hypothetical protein QXX12_04005 [Nanopusillaceae archaeon]